MLKKIAYALNGMLAAQFLVFAFFSDSVQYYLFDLFLLMWAISAVSAPPLTTILLVRRRGLNLGRRLQRILAIFFNVLVYVTIALIIYLKYIFTYPPDTDLSERMGVGMLCGMLASLVHFMAAGLNIIAISSICPTTTSTEPVDSAQYTTVLRK